MRDDEVARHLGDRRVQDPDHAERRRGAEKLGHDEALELRPQRSAGRRRLAGEIRAGCAAGGSRRRWGLGGPQLHSGHLRIVQHGVDLPRGAVGIIDPDLVLYRVAAGHPLLGGCCELLLGEAGGPLPSIRTSLSGGSATAKLA